jgi:hypothetical protein
VENCLLSPRQGSSVHRRTREPNFRAAPNLGLNIFSFKCIVKISDKWPVTRSQRKIFRHCNLPALAQHVNRDFYLTTSARCFDRNRRPGPRWEIQSMRIIMSEFISQRVQGQIYTFSRYVLVFRSFVLLISPRS